jgi:general secretion pathway protein A
VLREHAQETSTEQAFSALFKIWGGKLAGDQGRPCDQALHQGFECVYQKGSWAQLRMLNRPAILSLTTDDGSQHQLVLTGLTDDDARVQLGDAIETVRVADISRYWFGDYLLLWKPQVAGQKSLMLGMRGPEVHWLRKSLNSVQGHAAEPAIDVFDENLAHMVENFQREHHLNVDGIAGVQTQIVLDTIVNPPGAPLLLAASGG